jgi:H+/Cl- antiporter ClcA
MKRRPRLVATGLLVFLAAALILGIVLLHDWGGRIEAMLLVFGDRVWVTLDSGRPRLWFLLLIPGVFLAAAFSLYRRRPGE